MLAPHACVRPAAPGARLLLPVPPARPALRACPAGGRAPARRCCPPPPQVAKAAAEASAAAPVDDDDAAAPPPAAASAGLLREMDGSVTVRDDLDSLLTALPADIRSVIADHPHRPQLLEVVLDLGRRPEARFLGGRGGEFLRDAPITWADLQAAEAAVGQFGGDNRAGVEGTLHRISAIRNRRGSVIGLTCRVGRAVTGHISLIRDILPVPNSILFLGRPGVGKTTVIREMARVLADELHKRVVIVDTSNEIGGDGDVPHPAIGGARRMQVPDPSAQHRVMVEAVENHMPEVVIVDEIGTEAEALACRTIAERGVQLVGTAHGQLLENLMKNPTLSDLVGGIQSVTLGDDEARARGTQKSVLERRAPPTFPLVIEMRDRALWVAHWVEDSVDCLLHGKVPVVQVRRREAVGGSGGGGGGGNAHGVVVDEVRYDSVDDLAAALAARAAEAAAAATAAAAASEPPPSAVTASSDSDELAGYVPAADGSPPTAAEPYAWAAAALRDVPDTDALAGLAAIQGGTGSTPGASSAASSSSFTPPGRAAASAAAAAANTASISQLLVNGTGTGRRGKRRAK